VDLGKERRLSAIHVPFGLPRPTAEQLIRDLARAGKFALEPHAKAGMRERDFTMRQVLATLYEGSVNQGPRLDESNCWRCRVRKRVAGRLVHVVVAIHDMSYLFVISVH
jgi:hypothetical protein